jgi:hypothetical protein
MQQGAFGVLGKQRYSGEVQGGRQHASQQAKTPGQTGPGPVLAGAVPRQGTVRKACGRMNQIRVGRRVVRVGGDVGGVGSSNRARCEQGDGALPYMRVRWVVGWAEGAGVGGPGLENRPQAQTKKQAEQTRLGWAAWQSHRRAGHTATVSGKGLRLRTGARAGAGECGRGATSRLLHARAKPAS